MSANSVSMVEPVTVNPDRFVERLEIEQLVEFRRRQVKPQRQSSICPSYLYGQHKSCRDEECSCIHREFTRAALLVALASAGWKPQEQAGK